MLLDSLGDIIKHGDVVLPDRSSTHVGGALYRGGDTLYDLKYKEPMLTAKELHEAYPLCRRIGTKQEVREDERQCLQLKNHITVHNIAWLITKPNTEIVFFLKANPLRHMYVQQVIGAAMYQYYANDQCCIEQVLAGEKVTAEFENGSIITFVPSHTTHRHYVKQSGEIWLTRTRDLTLHDSIDYYVTSPLDHAMDLVNKPTLDEFGKYMLEALTSTVEGIEFTVQLSSKFSASDFDE